jgi:prepilin-type N-terminal cleavage/methylation domain-containing protein
MHDDWNIVYRRGFTLIELLVVIAIIGILAGIVVASLGTARSSGVDTKTLATIASMRNAAELYAIANSGNYGADTVGNCSTSGSLFIDSNSGMIDLVDASNYSSAGLTRRCVAISAYNRWAFRVGYDVPGGVQKYFCVDYTGLVTTAPLATDLRIDVDANCDADNTI